MKNGLVTIVVPVYNVEQYIIQCINSILNQTYTNIEVILSDDGSTDNSGTICDEYMKKDKRIRVIHGNNAGLSEARNRGIEIANGEYICFIDSDDYIKDTYIEYLLNIINRFKCDIAICPLVKDCLGKKSQLKSKNIIKRLSAKKAFDLIFTEREFVGVYACNKMYKTYLFNNVRYPKGRYFEDSGTTYKLIGKSKTIGYGDVPQYYYRIGRDGAITNDSLTKQQDRYNDKLSFLNEMEKYFKNNPNVFSSAFYNMYLGDLFIILSKTDKCSSIHKKVKTAINHHLSTTSVKSLSRNVGIKLLVYRISPRLFELLFR